MRCKEQRGGEGGGGLTCLAESQLVNSCHAPNDRRSKMATLMELLTDSALFFC